MLGMIPGARESGATAPPTKPSSLTSHMEFAVFFLIKVGREELDALEKEYGDNPHGSENGYGGQKKKYPLDNTFK